MPGRLDPAGTAASITESARQTSEGLPQGRAAAGRPLRRLARAAAASAPHCLYVRPELDSDTVGVPMRDAIERGGYRAALYEVRSP